MTERKDFFISYNQHDEGWAKRIVGWLEEAGFTTLVMYRDFQPGCDFVQEMDQGVINVHHIMALLSPDYIKSDYCKAECNFGVKEDPVGKKRFLVPVRIRECNVKGLIGSRNHIDLVELAHEDAEARFLKGIKLHQAKAQQDRESVATLREVDGPVSAVPGGLPSICNLIHDRNPNFTGREEILSRLAQALREGKPAAVLQAEKHEDRNATVLPPGHHTVMRHAVTGLGGIGKTQLALEFAYRYASDYSIIWWIDSEEPVKLHHTYAALAEPLKVPVPDKENTRQIVSGVRNWLDHHDGWLPVFDNARDPNDLRGLLAPELHRPRDHNLSQSCLARSCLGNRDRRLSPR